MNKICERLREEAALLGRVAETEDLKEHAATCPECSGFLTKLASLENDLAELRSRDASDDLVSRTLARPELNFRPSIRWRPWAMALASAASVAFLAFLTTRSDYRPKQEIYSFPDTDRRQTEGAGGGSGGGVSPEREEDFERDMRAPDRPQAAPELAKEQLDSLKSLGYTSGEEGSVEAGLASGEDKLERADEFRAREELGKKDAPAAGGRIRGGFLLDETTHPAKRVHRDPAYPESAKTARVQGTVVLELTVNRAGDVVAVRLVSSVPLLDAAAVEAVRAWKYAPSDSDAPRVFRVSVPFTLEEPEDDDRGRVDGLAFQEAKGYWANTYLPGDPMLRSLEHRLGAEGYPQIHRAAFPASLPYDATSTGALSLFLHADRKGVTGKTRLLVQVGIRASERHGRRRPPMNVGVVLDLPKPVSPEIASTATALLESLESSQELGDRFRLIATGAGELVAPEAFRRGPLTVALQDLYEQNPSGSLSDALALGLEKVHAGDDPTMPLGTSLVLLVSGRGLGDEIETLSRMAQTSAMGGVAVSVVGVGANLDVAQAERLALDGQGRRYDLELPSDASSIIDRELSSASRTVARAVRLRIQLAEGVRLVDVLGSEPLSARESERVRAEERAVDLRLARNLGIEADRGKDEDGIQIVIPAFYAGDAHSILLDVVADGPGAIAEVTARYKDLVQLENTVSRASLRLARSEHAPGPLEAGVENDYRELRVARALLAASEAVERGDTASASQTLQRAMAFAPERDRLLLAEYLRFFPQLPANYLRDSLLYASALKRSHS